jgi:hypothetical protein
VKLHELACDRESEAGAVVPPRGRGIHLRELEEDQVVMLGRDADAGITDLDDHVIDRLDAGWRVRGEPDTPAGGREVQRVPEQVADDVGDLLAIGVNVGQIPRDVSRQLQALASRERLVQGARLFEHLCDVEHRRGDGELIRRASRVVEDLADLLQELASAVDDAGDALQLPVTQLTEDAVAQDLGVRDDGRQRRPKVVRDVGEKLRLEGVLRPQLLDHPHRVLVLRLEQRISLLDGRRGGLNTGHMAILRQDGRSASASCSDSNASSNCCRLRSDQ